MLGMDKTLTEAFVRTPETEALFQSKLVVITAELEDYAESIDAATQWRYMNYVNPTQDPLRSYGAEVRPPYPSGRA